MNKKCVDESNHNRDEDDDDNSIPEILEYDNKKVNEDDSVKDDDDDDECSSSIPEEIGIGYYTDVVDLAIADDKSSSIPEDLGYPTDIEDSDDDRQYLNPKITSTRMKSGAKLGDGFKDTSAQEEVMKCDDSSSSIPED